MGRVNTVVSGAALTFLVAKLATNLVNLRTFPRLSPDVPPPPAVREASLLVPARDEADELPRTLPSLVAQGAGEVLLLDDGSTDGTAAVAASVPGVEVLTGAPLPEGWFGKQWACAQLADAAAGRWLVFTDADVRWEPGALAGMLAACETQRAAVGSVFPGQDTPTWGERLTVPLIDDVLLSWLPFPLLHAEVSTAAVTANGQALAFRRDAYDRCGGFAAVADVVLEDVTLARLAREAGDRVALAVGRDVLHTRMYRGYHEVRAGFGKNLVAAHAGSRALLAADVLWHLLVYTAPVVLARRSWRWRCVLALGVLQRAVVLATTGRPLGEAVLAPLLPLAGAPVAFGAMRRRQTWKGRPFPVRRSRP